MIALILFGFVLAIVLMVAIALTSKPLAEQAPRVKPDEELERLGGLDFQEFQALCQRALERMGLNADPPTITGPAEFELTASDSRPFGGDRYLVLGIYHPPDGIVESPRLMALASVVQAEQVSKGIAMTTGTFSEEAMKLAAGVLPIILVDGRALLGLVKVRVAPSSAPS